MRRTPWTTCKQCGKRAYFTERDAERALHDCQHAARRVRVAGLPVARQERRIYQCDFTDYWHLTSMRSLDY